MRWCLKELFVQNLPRKPWAGEEKHALRVMTLRYALAMAYIQFNPPKMAHWLVFDCDHENVERWSELGLPAPNYIARNFHNGKHHIAYAIRPVCTSENARPANLRLLALLERAYQNALGADKGFAGTATKNPLSGEWRVQVFHSEVVDLHYLADFRSIDLDKAASELWGRGRQYGYQPTGFLRNCDLFHLLRFWSYAEVSKHDSYMSLEQACAAHAETINAGFNPPLEHREVRSVVRSVARFTWRNREHFSNYKLRNRGVMGLRDAQLDTRERQSAGAEYTAMLKRQSSEKAVQDAIAELNAQGKRVSKAAVGRIIGMSRTQVSQQYSYLFD